MAFGRSVVARENRSRLLYIETVVEKHIMEPDIDYAEDWPDQPTDEEMTRHHLFLVEQEVRLLEIELARYRNHVARLVDMHAKVSGERDDMRKQLAQANERISDLLRNDCETWKKINSLQNQLAQRGALLTQYKVPDRMWDPGAHPSDLAAAASASSDQRSGSVNDL